MEQIWQKLKQNQILIIVIVIVIVGLSLYANTFRNQMFWDDNDFILNNQYVQNFDVVQMFKDNVIAGSGIISNYWRPMLLLVFSVEYQLWGLHPAGYHVVNLLFHIADAILIFYLLRALFKRDSLAFLTSLIFLIHPLQTEAVTYVNSLGDSLSVLFMLLGLNNYLYFRTHPSPLRAQRSFWWSVVFFPLALMSKETAIVYPGLILLIELFAGRSRNSELVSESQRRDPEINSGLRQAFKFAWPSFAITAFYILLRATVLNFQNTFNLYNEQNIFTQHVWIRILTFFKSLWVYLSLLIYPRDLHMERGIEIAQRFSEPTVVAGFAFFVLLISFAIWLFKKRPEVSFGSLWFLISLAPVSNILIPINGLIYEHWLYLPMVGFWMIIFSLCSGSLQTSKQWRTKVLRYGIGAFFTFYLLFFTFTTITRNAQWHDPIRFYNQTLQYAPNSYRVINNLGMAYDDAGDYNKAIELYQRAISLDPSVQVAYHNLGNSYKALGQIDLAIKNFELAISQNSKFFYSYNALIQIYQNQNQPEKIKQLQEQYRQATAH